MHQKLELALGEFAEPLLKARSFGEVAHVGVRFLERNASEGGYGVLVGAPHEDEFLPEAMANFHVLGSSRVMRAVVSQLKREGQCMFDFGLFTPKLFELYERWVNQNPKHHTHESCEQLFTDFYEPLLACRLIQRVYFIQGTEGERGTNRLLVLSEKFKKLRYELPLSYYLSPPPLE